MTWKCPQCGEVNPEKARLCGMCGEMRPEEKPQEIIARHLGPPPVATPSYAVPASVPPTQQWRAPVNEEASSVERRRMAQEAAARIAGRPPGSSSNSVGGGTWLLFVLFFPWSLMVLPMPGGMRNKKAGKALLIIALVALVVGGILGAIMLRQGMHYLPNITNQYKDVLGGE